MPLTRNYPVNRIGQREVIAVPVSFETNEIGVTKLAPLPFRYKLISVKSSVTKALAASNDGTIVAKKGASTLATVTIAASAAIAEEDTAPSVTGTAFDTTDQITLTTAKSSAGGKAIAFVEIEILPSHS